MESPSMTLNEAAEDKALWILKARHEELGSMFRTVWDNYIKFYTVFLTFSLGAMSWLVTQQDKYPMPRRVHRVIAMALILQSLLTAITSASIAMYSRTVTSEQLSTEDSILGSGPRAPIILTPSIPGTLGMWAGVANCIAMIGMIAVWIYVGFYMT
jgi:hypothetical protein